MIRYFFFLIAAITAASSVGYAQDSRTAGHAGTAQQQRACRPDALRLCRGIHDDEAIFECLKAHIAKLIPRAGRSSRAAAKANWERASHKLMGSAVVLRADLRPRVLRTTARLHRQGKS